MTPTVETSIWLALKARVQSLPLQIAKAWPAEKFTVPALPAGFIRVGRVSIAPVRELIADGKPHNRTGMLMVTLVQPLRYDVSVYDEQAGKIAEHFTDGTQMYYNGVCVNVTSYPHVQEGYEDNGYWTVPVSIPWRAFA